MSRKLASILLIVVTTGSIAAIFATSPDLETTANLLAGASIALIGLSLLLERKFPFRSVWNKNQGDLRGDLTSFFGVFVILDGALNALAPVAVAALLGPLTDRELPVPFAAEVVLVFLLIELMAYATHRVHHQWTPLWRLHAMHHSAERLYTLNNFRFHPVNHIFNSLMIVTPPLLIGFSAESVLAYTALTLPILVFGHANIDLEFGRLNYILNTNEVHGGTIPPNPAMVHAT